MKGRREEQGGVMLRGDRGLHEDRRGANDINGRD